MAQAPRFAPVQIDPYSIMQSARGFQQYQQEADEQKRQRDNQRMLSEVAQANPNDPDSWVEQLNARGNPTLALDLQKQLRTARTEQATQTKTTLENMAKRFEMAGTIVAGIQDEPSFQRGRRQIHDILGPDLAQHLGETYDPAVIEQAKLWGTTETERLARQKAATDAYEAALKRSDELGRNAPETTQKWIEAAGQAFSVARTPEEWSQIGNTLSLGGLPRNILDMFPPEFSPEAAQQAGMMAMSPTERGQQAGTEALRTETARHNRAMEAKPAGGGATAPVSVMGPDGQPVYVSPQEAMGRRPASTREQGRPVTSADAGRFAELQTSMDDLAVLRQTLRGTPEAPVPSGATGTDAQIGAALPNWVTNMTGWGTDAKKRQAVIDRVKQVIGKALEGGVLRKEDEIKYEKILPTISDPPDVAEQKLKGLEQAIDLRLTREIEARSDAGYDTSRFASRRGGQNPGTGMVTLIAPDGTEKQVPESEAGFYESRGARRK